jgi:hypothetical protein
MKSFFVALRRGAEHHGRFTLFVLLFLAVVLRLVPLVRPGTEWAKNNRADSNGYIQLAAGLRGGCGFAREVNSICSAPEILRTPGYPIFLTLSRDMRIALAVQALLGALVCLLIGYPVYIRWGPTTGIVSASLVALDLSSIVWATQIMSEILFQFLLAIAVLFEFYVLTTRFKNNHAVWLILSSGAFVALAILVKPIGIMLIPAMASVLLVAPRVGWPMRAMLTSILILVPVLMIAAWTQRNASVAGVPTFSAISAKNLYFYRAASVIQSASKLSQKETQDLLNRHLNSPEDFSLQSDGPITRQSAETVRNMNQLGWATLKQHPMTFGEITFRDFIYLLATPGVTDVQLFFHYGNGYEDASENLKGKLRNLVHSPIRIIAAVMFYWCLMLLTYVGVALALMRCVQHRWCEAAAVIFPFLVAMMLLLAAAGPEGGARLRVPAVPFLSMVAAVGLCGRTRGFWLEPRDAKPDTVRRPL